MSITISGKKQRRGLFAFGRFAHNPQRVLAAVQRFALVGNEGGHNRSQGVSPELRIAAFADADERRGIFNDSQFALLHGCSLARLPEGI